MRMNAAENEDKQSLWNEVQPYLDNALMALPVTQRDAIALRYLEGLSLAEVAREMRCPEDAAESRIRYGLARLRDKLCKRGAVVSTILLAALLQQEATYAMPEGLANSLKFEALQNCASPSVQQLAQSVIRSMYWTTAKVCVLATICALILAVPPLVYLNMARTAAQAFQPVLAQTEKAAPTAPAAPALAPEPAPQQNSVAQPQGLNAWIASGVLVSKVTAKSVEFNMSKAKDSKDETAHGLLIDPKIHDISQGAVASRLVVTIPKTPSVAIELMALLPDNIRENLAPEEIKMWKPTQQRILSLLYGAYPNGQAHKARTFLCPIGGSTREPLSQELNCPVLEPGEHTFELVVAQDEVWSCVDGQTVFRGKYGAPAQYAQFGVSLWCRKSAEGKITFENVSVGKAELLEHKEDF